MTPMIRVVAATCASAALAASLSGQAQDPKRERIDQPPVTVVNLAEPLLVALRHAIKGRPIRCRRLGSRHNGPEHPHKLYARHC